MEDGTTRRSVLKVGGPAMAGLLAGCSALDGGGGNDDDDDDEEDPTGTNEAPPTPQDPIPKPDGPEAVTTTMVDPETVTILPDPETATVTPLPDPETDTVTTFTAQRSTPECPQRLVEPESSGGTATLWHARTASGTNLLSDTRSIFNAEYDHDLELTQVPNTEFRAKLRAAIPSGDGPHLFELTHDLAGSFDNSGFLSDQSSELRVDPCQYTETAWDAATHDGMTIGLPWAAESVALVYNRDIVDEPPETLDEMTAIMDEYHDPQQGQYGLGYPINPYYVSGFAQAYGDPIYDGEADELGVASDGVERGLRVVFDELKPYMPADPGYSAQTSVFQNGRAAFTIDGPWSLVAFDDADIDVGITTLPDLPGGGTPHPYMGVKLFYFGKKMDREPRAAVAAREFAEWYTTSESRLLNVANNAGFVPVNTAVIDEPELPPAMQGYAAQVETGYPMPANTKMNDVWGPFGDAILETFNSGTDLETTLADAETRIRDAWAE